ncbi:unnamed protein product [Rotaria sp. Silwood1]|nr:unnamed protein product [Rotaria sp. Silwood1]
MVAKLIQNVETIYADSLESGDRERAMKRLRVPPLEQKESSMATFRIGLFVGMFCLVLPAVFAFGFLFKESQLRKPLPWREALLLYRSPCLIIIEIILVGINMYGWSSSGVNHVLIFEIDPRNHLTYQQLLEIGTCFLVLWFLSFIGFIVSSYLDFYPFIQPLIFAALIILFLINPAPIFYRQSRFWFLQKLAKVFAAPFYQVGFADFWLGEQLSSLELIFFDLEFFFCFYASDRSWWSSNLTTSSSRQGVFCTSWTKILLQTCLLILPSWFRFAQNLRRYRDTNRVTLHLVNAGKSATGFFVVITNSLRRATTETYSKKPMSNPFLYLWIIASIVGATYKLLWDLKMDWGFFEKNAGENKYLRDHIVYSSKVYYYAAIIENIIFRYIWVINIFVHFHTQSAEYSDVIGFAFGIIEIFRRFIWNFFRLENEHLNNCDEFRAVRDISIVPISTDIDFALIDFKMSKEPGIRKRTRTATNGIISDEDNTTISSRISTAGNEQENNTIVLDLDQISTPDTVTVQQVDESVIPRALSVSFSSLSSRNVFSSPYSSFRSNKMTELLTYSQST